MGWRFYCFFLLAVTTSILTCGCSRFTEIKARAAFEEANRYSNQGSYESAVSIYEQIAKEYPTTGDRALFEVGVILMHPKNSRNDYEKAVECFNKIIKDYPESRYRHDSEMMIFYGPIAQTKAA